MAYKFQVGPAILSGSTKFEELVEAAGGFKPTVADTAAAVADDSFYFQDADGAMKRESMVDYAAAIAGDGLSADAGVLEVEVSELDAVTAIASGDTFAIAQEAETGDPTKKITFDNMALKLAGDGLATSAGVLSVGVDGSSIETNSDALRVKALGIARSMLAADAVDGSKLADDAVDSEHIADGSVDLAHMSANSVDSDQYVDGSIDTIHIADAQITLAKMAANSVDSDQYVDGSIDLAHMSANSVDSDQYVDGSIDTAHIADDQVTGAKLATNVADTSTIELSSDTLSVLKVPNALSQGDGIAAFSYDGSGALTVALSASVAGAGLDYASGVLKVNIDEFSALGGAGLHQTEDKFLFSDNGTEKTVTFSNLQDAVFAGVSGDATVAAGGALTIAAGAVHHSMLADDIIGSQGELAHADINDDDEMMIDDAGTVKKVGVDSLRDHFFGVVSGDATVADGGALTISADSVEGSMLHPDVAGEGLKQNGSGNLELDINGLGVGAVAVGADSIAILDADDNVSKKESIADLVSAMAGDGLVAASGQLSAKMTVTTAGDANYNAAFGLNINTANYTESRTVTLPSAVAGDAGRMLVIKARNAGTHSLSISRNGSDLIEGNLETLTIESDNGAVTLVCAGDGVWAII